MEVLQPRKIDPSQLYPLTSDCITCTSPYSRDFSTFCGLRTSQVPTILLQVRTLPGTPAIPSRYLRYRGVRLSLAIFAVIALLLIPVLTTNFDSCKAKVLDVLDGKSRSDVDFEFSTIVYDGPIRGLQNKTARRLTLSSDGCRKACGSGSDLNDVLKAFQILTIWVMPAIALLSQLPYEALSDNKWKNGEAFVNWVGAPASALTATMFNICMIRKARKRASRGHSIEQFERDAYYVLTCINQYEWPYEEKDSIKKDNDANRDKMLLYGLLRPISLNAHETPNSAPDTDKTRVLLANLAFQLRLQRRKAVWPLAIKVIWFLMAFIVSIVLAFASLGDNSTAHSLALGLLLSWLPVLVVMAIIDRNPMGATRCRVLIERWLYNVSRVFEHPNRLNSQPNTPPRVPQWHRDADMLFRTGEFVGQGRQLRYCGIAHAVISLLERDPATASVNPQDLGGSYGLKHEMPTRPWSWWVCWMASWIVVSMSFGMAFLVSFNTPTIGLGCRSLCYLIYYLLSLVSSLLQLLPERSPYSGLARIPTLVSNTLATLLLFLIMILQVLNGLNNCACKSSKFGSGYGGYMDFENADYYKDAYMVERFWAPAASFGLLNSFIPVTWAIVNWMKNGVLWKVNETAKLEQDGVHLDTVWLT